MFAGGLRCPTDSRRQRATWGATCCSNCATYNLFCARKGSRDGFFQIPSVRVEDYNVLIKGLERSNLVVNRWYTQTTRAHTPPPWRGAVSLEERYIRRVSSVFAGGEDGIVQARGWKETGGLPDLFLGVVVPAWLGTAFRK